MERLSPLFVLFLIYMFIGMIGKSNKNKKNANQRPGQNVRNQNAASPRPSAQPRQPSAEKPKKIAVQPAPAQDISYTAHRGEDGTLHPTERHQHATVAPSLLTMEGMGSEGYDPCHDYMLDDPVLPVCEDADQGSSATAAPASLPLSFSKDSMVNAVVMSEILNRRTRTRNR